MESTTNFNLTSSSANFSVFSSTTETSPTFVLSDYLEKNYIIIIIPSIFMAIFLIIIFALIIRKILNRHKFNPKQLETYSSVNYDDEEIDEDLENLDDIMYTSCKLLVGDGYEGNFDASNSEPEYDCMSVDATVSARESAIVDWGKENAETSPQELSQSLKVLPLNFWKR